MRQAAIVSTARTPIGVAFCGSLNNIKSPSLMAHAIRYAVDRAGIDDAEIEDVIVGSVLTGGTAGMNVARLVGHALLEGKRRGARNVVTSMCIGGGMGAAALFEIV